MAACLDDNGCGFHDWVCAHWRKRCFLRHSLDFLFPRRQLMAMPWAQWLQWFYHMSADSQFQDRSAAQTSCNKWNKAIADHKKARVASIADGPLELVKFLKAKLAYHKGFWSAPARFIRGVLRPDEPMVVDDLALAVQSVCDSLLDPAAARAVNVSDHLFFEVTNAYPEKSKIATAPHVDRVGTNVSVALYDSFYVMGRGAQVELDAGSMKMCSLDLAHMTSVAGLQCLLFWERVKVEVSAMGLSKQQQRHHARVNALMLPPPLEEADAGALTVFGRPDRQDQAEELMNALFACGATVEAGQYQQLDVNCPFTFHMDRIRHAKPRCHPYLSMPHSPTTMVAHQSSVVAQISLARCNDRADPMWSLVVFMFALAGRCLVLGGGGGLAHEEGRLRRGRRRVGLGPVLLALANESGRRTIGLDLAL